MTDSPIRVLLVDDSQRDLQSLERTLRAVDADLEVVGAADGGAEALRLAETTTWDVAIVDYRMPGMNGVELAERLKGLRPEAKVVVITAFDEARDEIESSPWVDHYQEKMALDALGDDLRALVRGDLVPAGASPKRSRGFLRRR